MSSIFQMMKSLEPHLREIDRAFATHRALATSMATVDRLHVEACKELEKISAICRNIGHLIPNTTGLPGEYIPAAEVLLAPSPTRIDFSPQDIIPEGEVDDEDDDLPRRPIGFRLRPDT